MYKKQLVGCLRFVRVTTNTRDVLPGENVVILGNKNNNDKKPTNDK